MLSWDQQVMMPKEGGKPRAQQLSILSKLHHQLLTSREIAESLDEIQKEELDEEKRANIREIERRHDKAKQISEKLIEEISQKQSETFEKWQKAKQKDDFSIYQKDLEEMIELKKEYAKEVERGGEIYKVLFDDFEPYISLEKTNKVLKDLKNSLKPLIEQIEKRDKQEINLFEGNFPEEKQKELVDRIAEDIGYPREEKGRIDKSEHPFTAGNQFDCRITLRYDENDLMESISSLIHESGHAFYQLGLPKEKYGEPAGTKRELSIHESQSRLWENHILKSRAFAKYLLPKLKEIFPEQFDGADVDDIYRSMNQVNTNNPIRVKADEITYQLHIIIRFELEKQLISGEIQVKNLSEKWDEKMEKYFGFKPENNTKGVLQDAQWAHGAIGYFPTYTLGNLIAAQLNQKMREEIPSLNESIAEGDFEPVLGWLRENIHKYGQTMKTEELIENATGQRLTPKPFLDYIEDKYSELYDLER